MIFKKTLTLSHLTIALFAAGICSTGPLPTVTAQDRSNPEQKSDRDLRFEEQKKDLDELTTLLGGIAKEWDRKYGSVEALRAQVAKGDAKAMGMLGNRYHNGEGVQKDAVAGVQWYTRAAEKNFIPAVRNLGTCYKNGWGVAKDHAKARELYKRAVDGDDTHAMIQLAGMWLRGDGGTKNLTETFLLMRRAAHAGNEEAFRELAWCYKRGLGVKQNYDQSKTWFRKAAEAKEPCTSSMFQLGTMARDAIGSERDQSEALKWFIKASELKHKPSTVAASNILMGQKRYSDALKYLKRAVSLGEKSAYMSIASIYSSGALGQVNDAEANKWVNSGIEAGVDDCMVHRATQMLLKSKRNPNPAAIDLLSQAIDAGNPSAMEAMGLIYELGLVGKNPSKRIALSWFRKASENGDESAKERLKKLEMGK